MDVLNVDCVEYLKKLNENSIDALVTDPPSGISFMGKEWDSDRGGRLHWIKWMSEVMTQCFRVMKPGAHGLVWAIPRTSHWTATALEDSGFEIRDVITHLFGSGFPKSLNISKAIDKAAGAEREVVGQKVFPDGNTRKTGKPVSSYLYNTDDRSSKANGMYAEGREGYDYPVTAPSTPEAKKWEGWGTSLKPASEHWILIRKPLAEKTIAANVLKWGTGGINIDGSRIGAETRINAPAGSYLHTDAINDGRSSEVIQSYIEKQKSVAPTVATGRFPANLILSHNNDCVDQQCTLDCAVASLDAQSGTLKSGARMSACNSSEGGASRFFKVFKDDPKHAIQNGWQSSNIDANNAQQSLQTTQVIEQKEQINSVLKNVTLFIDSVNHCLNVKSAENNVNFIEIDSVLEVAKTLNRTDLHLLPCQDYTLDYKNSILIQNLVSLAESLVSTDIILTIISLLRLSGYASSATEEDIKLASLEKRVSLGLGQTRFRYQAKASKSEKNKGCEELPEVEAPLGDNRPKNTHPTVKPIKLMSYLITLITPPHGIVLDPFMGSGSTGVAAKQMGFNFIGIEKDRDYFNIAMSRLKALALR